MILHDIKQLDQILFAGYGKELFYLLIFFHVHHLQVVRLSSRALISVLILIRTVVLYKSKYVS